MVLSFEQTWYTRIVYLSIWVLIIRLNFDIVNKRRRRSVNLCVDVKFCTRMKK